MSREMEKLVEEMRLVWCKDCGDGPSRYEYSPDLDDDACEGGIVTIKWCRERARECVTLILSAFRDGRLDEELGVIDRTTLVRKKKGNRFWEATGFHPGFEGLEIRESQRSHQAILIALSGAGKEER